MAEEKDKKRAIFEHCTRVYQEMRAQAEPRRVLDVDADEPEFVTEQQFQEARVLQPDLPEYDIVMIYEGFLTKLFTSLSLSVPYYTQVMQELKRLDSVRQIKRGGGSAKSIWVILDPPDYVLFNNLPATTRNALGGRKIQLQIEQRIKDLVTKVDSFHNQHGLALANMEERLQKLEKPGTEISFEGHSTTLKEQDGNS